MTPGPCPGGVYVSPGRLGSIATFEEPRTRGVEDFGGVAERRAGKIVAEVERRLKMQEPTDVDLLAVADSQDEATGAAPPPKKDQRRKVAPAAIGSSTQDTAPSIPAPPNTPEQDQLS